MTEPSIDEAPLHGSFGCRPALQSDEFGSYYACSCGWRSDDGQAISKARSVVASLRGVVQAAEARAAEWQRNGWGSASDYDKGAQRAADEILSIIDHWRRGAAAAVRCPECNHQPGCACPDSPTPHGCQTCLAAAADAPQPTTKEQTMTTGAELIAAERQRQINVEARTPEHDAEHDGTELVDAAECYLTAHRFQPPVRNATVISHGPDAGLPWIPERWPWEARSWKPTPGDRVRELVKAGALIAAEIDRLTRRVPQSTRCDHGKTEPHDFVAWHGPGRDRAERCPGPSPAVLPETPEDTE